jgi:hypothetical protein
MTASQPQEPGSGSRAPEPGSGPAPARRTFDSLNPATGQPTATVYETFLAEPADRVSAGKAGPSLSRVPGRAGA